MSFPRLGAPFPGLFVFFLAFFAWMSETEAKNMNDGPYRIANGLNNNNGVQYSTEYLAEYFEVYSSVIRTRYSEVFWAGMPPVDLPASVVKRFQNKTMAVVGYEVDQVQKQPSGGDDIPVPITHAYNHHYCSWLVNSKGAKLVRTKASEEMIHLGLTHGSDDYWATELLVESSDNDNDDTSQDPLVQFFSEGNGGEMRLSYHGFPKGYAQLIRGPDKFRLAPMQIDTWNRDEPSAKFKPGPLPRNSKANTHTNPHLFSGLLECPCSDRIVKQWNISYHLEPFTTTPSKKCEQPVQSETECWDSAQQVTKSSVFRHHSSPTKNNTKNKPIGCSLVQHVDGTVDVYWNHPPPPHDGSTTSAEQFIDGSEPNMEENEEATSLLASTWSRTRLDDATATNLSMPAAAKADKVAFAAGVVNITVAVQQHSDADDAVVILIVGPPDKWFGVGFGTHTMCRHGQSDQCPDGGPYAIIVEGDTVEERQLGYHGPGTVIPHDETWKVHRNEIVGGNRTVVVTRPRHGTVFSFEDATLESSLPIIMAKGCGMEFAQHCGHGAADLQFLTPETTTKICRSGIEGTIQNRKFRQEGRCPGFPRGDLKDHHNPTCTIETYQGGLFCCNHQQFLLDQNQTIPWDDQYLEYQMKFRFYFEEYQPGTSTTDKKELSVKDGEEDSSLKLSTLTTTTEEPEQPKTASHQNLVRLFWATEGAAGEYDITQCRNNTPPSQCVQVITSRFQVKDLLHDCGTRKDASYCTGIGSKDANQTAGIHLISAAPHCHANSCLSVELYNAHTGQLICRVEPIYGQSDGRHGPYGDEKGYLALPPCLWGSPSEGLPSPVLLPLDAELLSIKRNNNTFAHTGEMALWQMRGVVVPKK